MLTRSAQEAKSTIMTKDRVMVLGERNGQTYRYKHTKYPTFTYIVLDLELSPRDDQGPSVWSTFECYAHGAYGDKPVSSLRCWTQHSMLRKTSKQVVGHNKAKIENIVNEIQKDEVGVLVVEY